MGTNNLSEKAEGDVILNDDPNQYEEALTGDLVPRNTSGVPTNAAGDVGTSVYKWNNAKFDGTVESDAFKQTDNLPGTKSILTLDTDGTIAGDAQFGDAFTETAGVIGLADDAVSLSKLDDTARGYNFTVSLSDSTTDSTSYSTLATFNSSSTGATVSRTYMAFLEGTTEDAGLYWITDTLDPTGVLKVQESGGSAIYLNFNLQGKSSASPMSGFFIGAITIGVGLTTFTVEWKVNEASNQSTAGIKNARVRFLGFPLGAG